MRVRGGEREGERAREKEKMVIIFADFIFCINFIHINKRLIYFQTFPFRSEYNELLIINHLFLVQMS